MKRLVTLPVVLPLRIAALQLRLARASAEMALDMARELAGAAPWASSDAEGDVRPAGAAPPGAPAAPGDPAEPARAARRAASVQRTTARSSARASTTPARRSASSSPPPPGDAGEAPAAPPSPARPRQAAARPPAAKKRAATSPRRAARQAATPPSEGEGARPRPRRAARKATAAKPARERASEPTRAEVAAVRQADGDAAAVEGGPGPAVRVIAPWEGYDEMPLDQVLARLQDADDVLLAAVRLYETQGESRQAILLATEPS